jgi:hypothetical protein
MAIDTQKDRYSVLNMRRGFPLEILPPPDGAIDAEDRFLLISLFFVAYHPEMDDIGRISLFTGGRIDLQTSGTLWFEVSSHG